jgi:hypothetical protein
VPISTTSSSSPKEDIDVVSFVESVSDSPTKNKKSQKTSKEKVKSSTKLKAKSTSPNVRGMATRSTPVKLFKSSLPPYARKCVSFRQSAGVKKMPTPRKVPTAADVTDEERSLVSDSAKIVEVIDSNLPVSTVVVDDVQPSKNNDGKGEDDYHKTRSTDQVSDTQMETSVTSENIPQPLNVDQPEIVMEVETLTENAPKELEVLMEFIGQDALSQPNIFVADAPVDSTSVLLDKAVDHVESSEDIVVSATSENSCLVLDTLPEGSTLSTNSSVPNSCAENPDERICNSETTMSPLCEQRLPLIEEPPLAVLSKASPANCVESSSPYLDQKLKPTQKLSSPSAIASKEKTNRASNTKLKNYLRLQNLSTTSPQIHPTVNDLSVSEGNSGTQVKSPASSNRQQFQPQTNVIMDKELVKKMRKQLRMSKEINLYSQ